MDDETSMRIGHRRTHFTEQLQNLSQRKVPVAAVFSDWFAFNMIEGKVGKTVLQRSAFQKSSDKRMVQLRQYLAFPAKSLAEKLGVDFSSNDFDGGALANRLSLIVDGPFREINCAHPARTNLPENFPASNTSTGPNPILCWINPRLIMQAPRWSLKKLITGIIML
jgi:hypothetical protein